MSTDKKKTPRSFEEALGELEKITARLEEGEVPLDDAAALYERGAVLIEYCRKRLRAARGKILQLEKDALVGLDDVGE